MVHTTGTYRTVQNYLVQYNTVSSYSRPSSSCFVPPHPSVHHHAESINYCRHIAFYVIAIGKSSICICRSTDSSIVAGKDRQYQLCSRNLQRADHKSWIATLIANRSHKKIPFRRDNKSNHHDGYVHTDAST